MLNFEEFFLKKKIDLIKLQSVEPGLYAEFFSHYPLMGEKSFDHTKKYWFNKLRRTYPLAAEIKPHAVKAEAISDMAIQGMAAAAAQNLNETLEKPKFTEDHLPELVDKNVSIKEVSLAEEEKTIIESEVEMPISKSAFKPRFNAKNIQKPVSDTLPEPETEKLQPAIEPAKPAFKPRFNMQNIKKDVVKEASEIEAKTPEAEIHIENPEPKIEPAKPAFKPRFNMQNIKKDVVKKASEIEAKTPEAEIHIENPEPKIEPAKPAFKPRFNMQNIKKDVVKEASEIDDKVAEPETKKQEPETEPAENKEAKPVYKPRFQMKNLPKPAAENPPPASE